MISEKELKQIHHDILLENQAELSDNDAWKEISSIVYRQDIMECSGLTITDRHIDIEYSFGEYYEVREKNALFRYIYESSGITLPPDKQQEIVLFERK